MKLSAIWMLAGFACKLITLYFIFILLRFGMKKPKSFPVCPPKTRFAVVIAARNEQAVIGRLVESLLAQDYPRELFDVYAVPNNCTDRTAEAAYAAGAEILTCAAPVRCKGDALRQAFAQLEEKRYDAYAVFDADNRTDCRFLARLNDAFCAGARVVKGRHAAANPKASWVAGCYDIYFSGFDLLFNRPRAAGGLSAKLVGTGFAVKRDVLEEMGGWNTETIAEDAEFACGCALREIPVIWVPDAVTWDEEPVGFLASLTQRRRWSSGVMQTAGKGLPALAGKRLSPLRLDMLAFLLMPFGQGIGGLLLLASVISRLAEKGPSALPGLLLAGAFSGVASMAAAMLLLATERPAQAWNLSSVILFPLFMASWLPIQILCLFCRTKRWKPIRHTGVRQIDPA